MTSAIEAGFTRANHTVQEDDDCEPNTVEKCVSTVGQIEKPISVCVNFVNGSAKGICFETLLLLYHNIILKQKMKTTTLLTMHTSNQCNISKASVTIRNHLTRIKATASSLDVMLHTTTLSIM